ncbi:MAG: hypothetical protein R2770_14955 [Acidimicrobiales bacterium]
MGTSEAYECSSCGYQSGMLLVGVGMMASEAVPVSCRGCKSIFTVDRRYEDFEPLGDVEISEPGDPCPDCGGELVDLRHPDSGATEATAWDCPACGAHSVHLDPHGYSVLWD